jgi:hypothetical protein
MDIAPKSLLGSVTDIDRPADHEYLAPQIKIGNRYFHDFALFESARRCQA